ncbi:MAG: DNA polymerase III subunit delta [Nitrospiria bacterium]
MTYQEALRHFEQRNFSPAYLITGEESFFIRNLLEFIRQKGLQATALGFNFNQFQGKELSPEIVISISNTFPVASPRRIIIIQDADKIKDDQGCFIDYLTQPCETTLLIFVSEKPDMRKRLFQTLKKKACVIVCSPLQDRELPAWITQEARKKGLNISHEGLWTLKEHLGKDLLSIQKEIEKLNLYLSGEKEENRKNVSSKEILQVIGAGRTHSIFELTRAVGNRDCPSAIQILNYLLSEGAHPLFILTMLTRQWRQMTIAKQLIDSGTPEKMVGKKVPMPPGLFRHFLQQLKKWTCEELEWVFALSLSTDSALKGGRLSGTFILEGLILDLCLKRPISQTKIRYTPHF